MEQTTSTPPSQDPPIESDVPKSERPLPPPPGGHGVGRLALIGLILAAAAVLLFGILPRNKENKAQQAEAQDRDAQAALVTVVSAHFGSDSDLSLPGNIQAIATTPIYARAGGYVLKRFVDIGSRVRAGELLAVIQAPDMDQQAIQAHADTAKAAATTDQSRSDVQRLEALYAQTRSDAERAQANIRQAEAALADSRARVAQAEAAKSGYDAKLAASLQALESQKAAVAQSQAQLDLAEATAKRYRILLDQGFASAQDDDQAQATLKTARAVNQAATSGVGTAEANVDSARQDVKSAVAAITAARAEVVASQENVKAAVSALHSAQETARAAASAISSGRSVVAANVAAVGSQQANERRYRILSGFERIVAPFDGVITARNVDVGTLVNAGGGAALQSPTATVPSDGLFGISRIDSVRIQVNVPQAYSQAISPGARAIVQVREIPGRTFEGIVSQEAGALDSASRSRLMEVRLTNPHGILLPGMYAQVSFSSGSLRSLRVPADSVLYDAMGTRVVILQPDGKIHFQPVRLGRDFGNEIEITAGLRGDERLVNTPSDSLQEGMSAEALKAKAAPSPAPSPGPGVRPPSLREFPRPQEQGRGD
jgi:RND family efflux transporter MFP subunit